MSVEFVDYRIEKPVYENGFNHKNYWIQKVKVGLIDFIASVKPLEKIMPDKDFYQTYRFRDEYWTKLGLSKKPNYTPELDILFVGSDEVFNCLQENVRVGYSEELLGANNKAKMLVTYAASFGNTTVGKIDAHGKRQEISSYLKAFDKICNRRIACGEDAGKWLFGHRKFWIINNGVDTEAFRFNESLRVSVRIKLGISDEVLIGHVGRLNEQKNQTFLLDVFSELLQVEYNVKLLLIGDGPLEGVLKEKSTELNINNHVNFLGAVDNVNELINAVDLIVMPSLYEGLPLTLVEEQANGLVCIVSDSITREANLTGNLRFVSLNSPLDKWISIIQQEFSSENRKDLSEKGIQKIIKKGFDTSHTARIVEDIYGCE